MTIRSGPTEVASAYDALVTDPSRAVTGQESGGCAAGGAASGAVSHRVVFVPEAEEQLDEWYSYIAAAAATAEVADD